MNRDLSLLIGILVSLLALLLIWIFYTTLAADPGPRLATLALEQLPNSGVSHPVTAVLLNYRAYDTLLELAVLLAAILGIWSLGPAPSGFQPAGPALTVLANWIVPLAILTGGYLLWVGGHAPGGAFQAGALLGSAGVILRLAGHERAGLPNEAAQRWLVVAGVGLFLFVGLLLAVFGAGFLTYPKASAKWLILLIETAATIAIGTTLAAAYVGGRPPLAQSASAAAKDSGV
ncbi:Na(+)/H(+) antiporter subunit B [Lamprobacter modestohalophilus]|uniref:Na(+)/H(+) antiporter subunit B n=1 Tax=Lamprobacter modestohalophilus TaxID=1064514 RepID=UPI002ADEC510|nr:Na(+)/H(+) antiporter subunit B [Lamprobacter modestohalophilus]MEA1051541.1 Na(+)/H(+) antiporter subunit B [Lamprobacter modestohalophilus]